MEKGELKNAVHEVLDERDGIDRDTHRVQHAYVAEMIERRKSRRERWEKVRVQLYGWSVIVLLGAVGKFVWEAVMILRHHWDKP